MLSAFSLHDVKCGKFSSTYRNGCHSAWIRYRHSALNLRDKEVWRKSPLEECSCVTRKEVDLHSLSWLLQLEFKYLQNLFHSYHLNTVNVLLVPDQRIIQRRLHCRGPSESRDVVRWSVFVSHWIVQLWIYFSAVSLKANNNKPKNHQ